MLIIEDLEEMQTLFTSLNDYIQNERLPLFSTRKQVESYKDLLIGLIDDTQEILDRFNDILNEAYIKEENLNE